MAEAWLSSDNHEQFADAVVTCQSGAPWECYEAGRCARGGNCFTTDRQGAAVASRMIQQLTSENAVVRRHLDRAVAFLRSGEDPQAISRRYFE